ncbi:MAG: phosphoglycerate dehydrogenase [Euzebyales bacterium]|nr:phosphoglycerate dehydrogenase [Euzebyales bacterium]MBA3621848.1 phosphoglycerate dehydrogenase [Euzebyales bacterium]
MDTRPRVLVADALSEAGLAALSEHTVVDVRTGLSKAQLVDAIRDYDAVVVRSATTVDAEVIAAGERLRVIARAGIGLDNVDVRAATARGVVVCNAPQSNVISAAEHTVALLLALARNIPQADRSLRAAEWNRGAFEGMELHGKVLGVLGLGRVGTLVAQRCSAFGMRLLAYDPYVPVERAARMGVELVATVPELCAAADVVTVHLPRTPETVGIVGLQELRGMKPTARLVNTARGGIVDEEALFTALTDGWIAGAALDVFSSEPMTDSKLFALDTVVVTPHLGASTSEAQDKAGVMVAESVVQALRGEFVPSAVNLAVTAGIPEAVKPFLPLAERLGRLFTTLHPAQAPVTAELTVEYVGKIAEEDASAVTLSALKGLLSGVVHEPVTFVNAPLLAEERGLRVSTLTSAAARDYVSLLRLSARGAGAHAAGAGAPRPDELGVAGTLVGPSNRQRLVEVWGFDVDMEPSDHMVFFRYVDRPGVVGVIGGRLGRAGVNIATMQVGRREAGGEALIAMAVDTAIPPDVVTEIAELIGATDARALDLP